MITYFIASAGFLALANILFLVFVAGPLKEYRRKLKIERTRWDNMIKWSDIKNFN